RQRADRADRGGVDNVRRIVVPRGRSRGAEVVVRDAPRGEPAALLRRRVVVADDCRLVRHEDGFRILAQSLYLLVGFVGKRCDVARECGCFGRARNANCFPHELRARTHAASGGGHEGRRTGTGDLRVCERRGRNVVEGPLGFVGIEGGRSAQIRKRGIGGGLKEKDFAIHVFEHEPTVCEGAKVDDVKSVCWKSHVANSLIVDWQKERLRSCHVPDYRARWTCLACGLRGAPSALLPWRECSAYATSLSQVRRRAVVRGACWPECSEVYGDRERLRDTTPGSRCLSGARPLTRAPASARLGLTIR